MEESCYSLSEMTYMSRGDKRPVVSRWADFDALRR